MNLYVHPVLIIIYFVSAALSIGSVYNSNMYRSYLTALDVLKGLFVIFTPFINTFAACIYVGELFDNIIIWKKK